MQDMPNPSGKLRQGKWLLKDCHVLMVVRFQKAWSVDVPSHEDNLTQGECGAEFLGTFVAPNVREADINEQEACPTADLSTDAQCSGPITRLNDVVAAA
jgi:hypothetical protein